MLVERQDRPFEAVEPPGALLRRPRDHPEMQILELGLGVPRDLNAECHVCGEAGRT